MLWKTLSCVRIHISHWKNFRVLHPPNFLASLIDLNIAFSVTIFPLVSSAERSWTFCQACINHQSNSLTFSHMYLPISFVGSGDVIKKETYLISEDHAPFVTFPQWQLFPLSDPWEHWEWLRCSPPFSSWYLPDHHYYFLPKNIQLEWSSHC